MRIHIITVLLVSVLTALSGAIFGGNRTIIAWIPGIETYQPQLTPPLPANQVETIFLALDRRVTTVPVPYIGSGGGVASVGDSLIVMSHVGEFFDATGDTAIELDIAPPPNGWDEMVAFERANSDYEFANYYFRYNAIDVHENQLFVSFSEWVASDSCYRTSIATASVDGESPLSEVAITQDDWRLLYSTSPCLPPKLQHNAVEGHMAGGRIVISPDGTLFLASGDYGIDGTTAPRSIAQDPTYEYGKVIAIDIKTGDAEILSQGHSNMQGIALDGFGEVYAVEHGRRGGDEFNHIVKGNDYGWPQVSLGTRYDRLPLPNSLDYGRHPYFDDPLYAWLPSIAVSSMTYIDDFHPSWNGDFVAGSLRGKSLFRIRMKDGRVLFNEHIFLGSRIRDVHQHGRELIVWTDGREVIKLSPGEFDTSAQTAIEAIAGLDLTDRQKQRTEAALEGCAQCHSLGPIPSANAPALGKVFDAPIAAQAGYAYSDALRSLDGRWTRDTLVAYLSDPDAFANGTAMPNPQVGDPDIARALVEVLEAVAAANLKVQ